MRLAISSWCFGLALTVLGCDGDTNGTPPQSGGCAVGQQMCNGVCGPASACQTSTNTGGAPSTTPVVAGGQTQTPAAGGQTQTPAAGGQTQTPGSGGATTVATGGRTATGGSPATGGATYVDNPSVCDDTATMSATMTMQYARLFIPTNNPNKTYVAITNWWGSPFNGQTVAVKNLGLTVGNPNNVVTATSGTPLGFPSLFIGKYQANTSNGSNLPKLVSSIQSIPTVLDINVTGRDTSQFNATYDVWFTGNGTPLSDTAGDPGTTGALLMVWLYKPSTKQPRGAISASSHAVTGVSGSWNVWVDPNKTTRAPCVTYVSTATLSTLTFDLNNFIKDAVNNSYLVTNSMYLSIIFGGFEVWGGGDGATINNFCAKVN